MNKGGRKKIYFLWVMSPIRGRGRPAPAKKVDLFQTKCKCKLFSASSPCLSTQVLRNIHKKRDKILLSPDGVEGGGGSELIGDMFP